MKTENIFLIFDRVLYILKYPLLAFFAFFIYYSTFSHNFIQDDYYLLVFYQKFDFVREFIYSFFGGGYGFYRPINSIFYHFGYSFFGLDPTGYKIVILIFLILSSYLVFKICKIYIKDEYISYLASIIYISRSVHHTTLLNPSGFNNVTSDFFMLLSIFSYIKYKINSNKLYFVLSFIGAIGAFFSKEGSIILFLLIVLIELMYSNRKTINYYTISGRMLPFFFIFILYLFIIFFRLDMIDHGNYSMSFSVQVLFNNFIFFVYSLFNNPIEILLFIIFSGFCIISRINIKEFFNNNLLFIGIFFIGLIPYLFLKTHVNNYYTYYTSFSAVGFSIIFAYILLSKINKILYIKILSIIFIIFFVLNGYLAFQSYQDIGNPTNPFTYQERKSNNVLNYLIQTNLSYDNATIIFTNSDLNLYTSLGLGAAIKLNFKDVADVYFDFHPMPNITNKSNIYYFKFNDTYQNVSLISN